MANVISRLNECLQREIAAVETFTKAMDSVKDPLANDELNKGRSNHADRIEILSNKVVECGGEPTTNSGIAGFASNTVEGVAALFGPKAIVAALEEGEDLGLDFYMDLLHENDPELQAVAREMLPKQEETHNLISRLKYACEAAEKE